MLVPNRHGSSNSYRYGFNGMEKDNELKGIGNSYFTENRIGDPRIGRWLSLDPVSKPNISLYTMMSNSPIVRVDPKGDDDYYNEKGKFLYRDTKTSNEIRIITQAQFDRIQNKHQSAMFDTQNSHLGLLKDLDNSSRIIKNTITGDQIRALWKDSKMEVPLKLEGEYSDFSKKFNSTDRERRKEQSALIVLDVKKGELKLIREDDKLSTANRSGEQNSITRDSKYNVNYYKSDPNLVVIGNIHVHPFTLGEAKQFGIKLNLPYFHKEGDAIYSFDFKIPVYQLQINGLGKQLETREKSPGLIGTQQDAFNGDLNIGRDALETSGGNPQQTYGSPDQNKGG